MDGSRSWETLRKALLSLPNARNGKDERLTVSQKEDIVITTTFSTIPHYMFTLYREEHKKTLICIFRKNGRASLEPKEGREKNEILSATLYGTWNDINSRLQKIVQHTFLK